MARKSYYDMNLSQYELEEQLALQKRNKVNTEKKISECNIDIAKTKKWIANNPNDNDAKEELAFMEDDLKDYKERLENINISIAELKDLLNKENTNEQVNQKNKYFNENNIKNAVGDEGMKQLQENTIDPGQSFLNGENTNLMYEDDYSSSKKLDVNSNYKSNNIINSNQSKDLLTTGAATVMALSGDDTASQGLAAKGQSFIANKVSSTTASMASSTTAQTLVNGGATALGTAVFATQLVKNAPEALTTLAVQITSEAISVLSGEVAKIVGVYVGNHVTAITTWPLKVQSYAMAYFNAYKMSIGDVLKNLVEAAEDRSKKESEKNKESKMSKFISDMKTKMNSVTSYINDYVSTGTSYIQMVTSYIANGPDWVTDQIDRQLANLCETAEIEVNKQWEKDKNRYNESAKNTGDAIGAEMVEQFNKTLQKSQEKLLKKIENNKKCAAAKAAALLGKNKTKIAAMTGIYIP